MASLRERRARLSARIPRIVLGSAERAGAPPNPVATYYLVVIPALVLTIIGLLMGFSAQTVMAISDGANPYWEYLKPLGIILGASGLAFVIHKIPASLFARLSYPVFILAMALQSLVLTPLARAEGGNANWVAIPGLPFLIQPSEFLKLALLLALAKSLTHPGARLEDKWQMLVKAGGLIGFAIGFVMFGRDMGTAMIVAALAVGALWVAGLPKRWFLVLGFFAVPALGVLVGMNPTRIRRILAILPGARVRSISAPEQIDHSLWAFGSGGLTGLGPGASREKWNYLQAAHTDFIFAIIGEEFGLFGTLAVLTTIGLLVWGMIRVSQAVESPYESIVAAGVATWIGVQAIVNILSVTGVGPVIGVPLPLVSYGGSSFLFTVIAIGVVASFARADAGMTMWGRSNASTGTRDPRIAPRRRRADRAAASR